MKSDPLPPIATLFLAAIRGEVAPNTYHIYRLALHKLAPVLDRPVTEITLADLRILRSTYLDKYKSSTVNTTIKTWKTFFNWLVKEGELTHSPAERLNLVKRPARLRSAHLPDVEAMIAEARRRRQWRDVAIMALLLSTGIRVSAMCGIQLEHIDHMRSTVAVTEKGDKPFSVYLLPEVYNAIAAYVNYERPTVPSPYLFVTEHNPTGHVAIGTVAYILKGYARDLGITTPVNPHAFRHLFTVSMLANGAALDVVSKLLGHSSVTVTERFYAQWSPTTLQDAHKRYNPVGQSGSN